MAAVDLDSDNEVRQCPICLESLPDPQKLVAQPRCRHALCLVCAAQHFVLHQNQFCPTCREKPNQVVVSKYGVKSDSDHQQIVSYAIREERDIFYFESNPARDAFLQLFSIYCYICKQANSAKSHPVQIYCNFNELVRHMKAAHGMVYCDVCLEHLKTFPSNRRVYKPKNLKLHKLRGDFTSGFGMIKVDRHHLCKFCNIWFFDIDSLYKHCRSEHLYCTMCDGPVFDFYEDYDELSKHFKAEHHVCFHADCRDEQYVNIFKTHEELAKHLKEKHNITLKIGRKKNNKKLRDRQNKNNNNLEGNVDPNQKDSRNINFNHSAPKPNADGSSKNNKNQRQKANINSQSNFGTHEAFLEGTLASTIDEQIEIENLQSQLRASEQISLVPVEEYPTLFAAQNELDHENSQNLPMQLSNNQNRAGYAMRVISKLKSTNFEKSLSKDRQPNWVHGNAIFSSNNATGRNQFDSNANNKLSNSLPNININSNQISADRDLAQKVNWSLNIEGAKNLIRTQQNMKQCYPKSTSELNELEVRRKKNAFKKLGEQYLAKEDPDFPPGLGDLFQK